MRTQGTLIYAGNSNTLLASGVVYSGVHGDAKGDSRVFITELFAANGTIFNTNAGAGSTDLIELAAGSYKFDPPLVCPKGAGVYTNAYDASMRYYLKDGFARSGSYS